MKRVSSALRHLGLMCLVLNLLMPLSIGTVTAEEAATEEQLTEQTIVPDESTNQTNAQQESTEQLIAQEESAEQSTVQMDTTTAEGSDSVVDQGTTSGSGTDPIADTNSDGNTDEGMNADSGNGGSEIVPGNESPDASIGDEIPESIAGDESPDAGIGDESPESIPGDNNLESSGGDEQFGGNASGTTLDPNAGNMTTQSTVGGEELAPPVIPAQPVITGNVCVDGVYTPLSATFGPTTGVSYGDVDIVLLASNQHNVQVTAMLAEGYSWASDLGEGWTGNGDGTASYQGIGNPVVFCNVKVIPAQPTIVGNTCINGVYTSLSATFGPTEHVTYSGVTVTEPQPGIYYVSANASLHLGYDWGDLQDSNWDGWFRGKAGTAYYQSGLIEKAPCDQIIEVTPAQPVITSDTCVAGVYTPQGATFGPTTGVTYIDVNIHHYSPHEGGGAEVTATATLADGYTWSPDPGAGWRVIDDRDAAYSASFGDLKPENPCDANVVLTEPTITGNTCVDGVYTPPSVSFGPTTGVTYGEVTITEEGSGDYRVITSGITMELGYKLDSSYPGFVSGPPDLGSGWRMSGKHGSLIYYSGTIEKTPCEPSTEVTPAQPVLTNRACFGIISHPTVATFGPTTGVVYSDVHIDHQPDSGSYHITATATLIANHTWASSLGSNWNLNEDGTARYSRLVTVGKGSNERCVTSVDPAVTQAVRTDSGEITPPSVTPATTEGIVYTMTGDMVPGGTVTVIASPADSEDYRYYLGGAPGWTMNEDGTATFTVILDEVGQDIVVTPAQPVASKFVCVGNASQPSAVTVGPTVGVTYSDVELHDMGGFSYRVSATATLADGYSWSSDLGDFWTDNGDGTAQYSRAIMIGKGGPGGSWCVTPVDPTATQAVRTDSGEITPPSVTPATTEGIIYTVTGDVVPGGTVIVTATPIRSDDSSERSYFLGEAPGWTINEDGTATFIVILNDVEGEEITEVIPVAPMVIQAGRTDLGEVNSPSVTLPTTEGITYSISGDVVPGSIVTVTATPNEGYVLGSAAGWTMNEDGTATFIVTLNEVGQGAVVNPANPTVVQASRTESGEITPPSVTPATTEGIIYTVTGDLVPGGTVTVTATPEAGYTLGAATGWTMNEDGTATFSITLDGVEGEDGTPGTPGNTPGTPDDAPVPPEEDGTPGAPEDAPAPQGETGQNSSDTTASTSTVTSLPATGTGSQGIGSPAPGLLLAGATLLAAAALGLNRRYRM